MITFSHLFHGTSTIYKTNIQENGLMPINGPIHLTTHPEVALIEAQRTVNGEANLRAGYKKASGGLPLIVIVQRFAVVGLKLDIPGYHERGDDRSEYRVSEARFAFRTPEPIAPGLLTFIERDCEGECRALLNKINTMTRKAPLGFTVKLNPANGMMIRVWMID